MKWLALAALFATTRMQEPPQEIPAPPVKPFLLFTRAEAESISGEAMRLRDSSSDAARGVQTYSCSWQPAGESGEAAQGTIYFMYEEYEKLALAQKKYSVTREANEDNGIIVLNDVGDEAYFQTDNVHFYFIIVHKANKIIRLKVNKITPVTSLDEFHRVARKITLQL